MVTLFLWMIVPLVMTIYFSLIRFNLMQPDETGFIGLANYEYFVTDPSFWTAIVNTLLLLGSVIVITVVGGVALGLLIDEPFPGRGVVRVLLISPFFVIPTVNALLWKHMMMNPIYGVLAQIWHFFGAQPVDWLTDYPLFSVIVMVAWQWLPFATLIFVTALQSMNREQLEAARMDGARYLQQLRYLYVPHLGRSIAVVIMIETIFLLERVRGDLHHHRRWSGGCQHQSRVPHLQAGAAQLRRRGGLRGGAGGGRPRQHRGDIPHSDDRQEPGLTIPLDQKIMAPKPPVTAALVGRTVTAWVVTLVIFFPLGWLVLTAFKTEMQAISVPPLLFFTPTLDNFVEVQRRSDYLLYASNSVITSVISTLLGLAIAFPAAYSMAFFRSRWTRDLLMWMLSTKMMPAVGALVPIYVLAQRAGLLDTRLALIIVFMLSNLPIMVWMLYASLRDIPHEILEAARMDGATLWQEFRRVLLPLSMGGLFSTGLLCLVLAWNEAFWSLNLTSAKAGTLATMIASYSSPEGLFWAKLSCASFMAIAPIVVFGWFSQRQLVQGLTFGAVK